MEPRINKLKRSVRAVAHSREEQGMTLAVSLKISGHLDKELVSITLNVRERVMMEISPYAV